MKKYFFGWQNIRYCIKEFIKIYSGESSFFSKKRIESGVSFAVAQSGMIAFFIHNLNTMTSSDLAIWSGIEFAVAGYMITQIQREKKTTDENKTDNTDKTV